MSFQPVAREVLQLNPQFASLHQYLATEILADDGSTRATNASYLATRTALRAHHLRIAKRNLLICALRESSSRADDEEVTELVGVMASYVADAGSLALTAAEHALMKPEVDEFRDRLAEVAAELGRILQRSEAVLSEMAAALSINQPRQPVSTPSLQPQVQPSGLKTSLTHLMTTLSIHRTSTLPHALSTLTTTLTTLLGLQSTHLSQLIRHLERSVHGTQARHLTGHAHFLATVAQGLEAKSRILVLTEQCGEDLSVKGREVLKVKMESLRGEERKYEERRQRLVGVLAEFEAQEGDGDGSGDGSRTEVFKSLGRRYGAVEEEIRRVKSDIERLQQQGIGAGGSRQSSMRRIDLP